MSTKTEKLTTITVLVIWITMFSWLCYRGFDLSTPDTVVIPQISLCRQIMAVDDVRPVENRNYSTAVIVLDSDVPNDEYKLSYAHPRSSNRVFEAWPIQMPTGKKTRELDIQFPKEYDHSQLVGKVIFLEKVK